MTTVRFYGSSGFLEERSFNNDQSAFILLVFDDDVDTVLY